MKPVARILIAHQSTIPPYRIPFYQAVERKRPAHWDFTVVYSEKMSRKKNYGDFSIDALGFKILSTRTIGLRLGRRRVIIQSFIVHIRGYDALVIEDALNNLSYPISILLSVGNKPVLLWGHGRDRSVSSPGYLKRLLEKSKVWLVHKAHGHFAYTAGVARYLKETGYPEENIFVLQNTMNISEQRQAFEQIRGHRDKVRAEMGLKNKKALLYVGRLNKRKRLAFLSSAVRELFLLDPDYVLIAVGDGERKPLERLQNEFGNERIIFKGSITQIKYLAPIFTASEIFLFPGDIGLGVLNALCYDLPPVVVESDTHNPEVEYLNAENSVMLPKGTSAHAYASAVHKLLADTERMAALQSAAWPSVKHLTIEKMADNFISGINSSLEKIGKGK